MVADRLWCSFPASRSFFRFYTRPEIVVYLADERENTGYADTLFLLIQNVLAVGGFTTFDLG